ncbi:hypothetical protein SNEBB_010405 [Seison nebaliae]|nr:hypothetical protein SNEBB_010405 [Seison nebaliae]
MENSKPRSTSEVGGFGKKHFGYDEETDSFIDNELNNNRSNNNSQFNLKEYKAVVYSTLTLTPQVTVVEDKEDEPTKCRLSYGWVVVLASFLSNVIVDGLLYAFGVLLVEFSNEFKASRAEISIIGSLACGTYMVIGPVVASVTSQYGCRVVAFIGAIIACLGFLITVFARQLILLYIGYGVIGGIGFGLIYITSVVVIPLHFKSFARQTGIAVSGSGVGTIIFPILTEYLISTYGWRGTQLIFAGIILQCAIMACFYIEPKHKATSSSNLSQFNKMANENRNLHFEKNNGQLHHRTISENIRFQPVVNKQRAVSLNTIHMNFYSSENIDGKKKRKTSILTNLCKLSLLKNPAMLLIFFGNLLSMVGYFVPYVYIVDRAVQMNVEKSKASFLISIIGITNTVGRVIGGKLCDYFPAIHINNISLLLTGLVTLAMPFYTNYKLLMLYSALFGLFIAPHISVSSTLLSDVTHGKDIAHAFGILTLARGLVGFFGSPLAGVVYDLTNSYNYAFMFGGFCIITSAILQLFIVFIMKREKK